MNDELATILDAMRAAQAELAAYLNSAHPDAELTLAKLVGILDRRDVVRATRLLRPARRPTAVSAGRSELIPSSSRDASIHAV